MNNIYVHQRINLWVLSCGGAGGGVVHNGLGGGGGENLLLGDVLLDSLNHGDGDRTVNNGLYLLDDLGCDGLLNDCLVGDHLVASRGDGLVNVLLDDLDLRGLNLAVNNRLHLDNALGAGGGLNNGGAHDLLNDGGVHDGGCGSACCCCGANWLQVVAEELVVLVELRGSRVLPLRVPQSPRLLSVLLSLLPVASLLPLLCVVLVSLWGALHAGDLGSKTGDSSLALLSSSIASLCGLLCLCLSQLGGLLSVLHGLRSLALLLICNGSLLVLLGVF